MKPLISVFLCLLLVSCGRSNFSAPRNLDNACSILDQRPRYLRAMKRSERKWDVPVSVQMATIYQESKFIGNARPPYRWTLGVIPRGRVSSAFGYSQALDGTWAEYQEQEGSFASRRDRIGPATDFIGWYMDKSHTQLGLSKSDAYSQYLAYHEGRTGYRRGSYNNKQWLLRVASKVQARANMYESQLRACGKI